MPGFQPFLMERMMSKYEKTVEYNLSESGVFPLLLSELLENDPAKIKQLLSTDLNYPYANGIPELRNNIAAMYDHATAENVLVTTGAIEANYNALRTLLKSGDEIAIMLPNYMQIWGVAKNMGLQLRAIHLTEKNDWALDLAELQNAVTPATKLIAICNPNNPTGYILTKTERKKIIEAASRVGAWILADEVYSGAERVSDTETPSFYSSYDKVIAVGSMSKAYGLPGLRIGWVVGPQNIVEEIWARHEYTTISAGMLANKLAAMALAPEMRSQLIQRARNFIREGFPVLQEWMLAHGDMFTFTPPQAAAISFIRYHLNINSTELVHRLCEKKSVLIVPGDHFGMDNFVRISFGLPHDYLTAALDRIHELLVTVNN